MGGCRRILGLDGCFLKHTCKDQLLTTMGRDANKAAGENNSQVTRHGKQIGCFNSKCRGRGFKCGDRGAMGAESGGRGQMGGESGGRGQMDVESYGKGGMGSGIRAIGTDSGGREGRSDGRETMGSARDGDNIKKSMEHEHMQGLLVEKEDLRQKQEKEHQDKLDEEALQQAREEDLMFERMDLEREREEQQWKAIMDPLNDCRFPDEEESMDVEMYNITKASINFMVNTHESVTHGQPSFE
nr:chloramphenicol acetyltransferase-like domain-containing protein [Tanacetum cinerariifolium]